MADENDVELTDPAEINAARAAFLSEPPPVLPTDEPPAPSDEDVDDIDGALAEVTPPPAPAVEGTPETAPPTSFGPFATQQDAETAFAVQEAMRTEQGVRALVTNGLLALGYSVDDVRQALEGTPETAAAPAPVDDPLSGLDDEDLLSVAQARALVEDVAARAAAQAVEAIAPSVAPLTQVVEQQQAIQVRANTDAAIIAVLGTPPEDPEERAAYAKQVDAVVARGSQYYDPNQWANPAHIRDAVTRASTELAAESEQRYQAYLQGKKRARDSQPVNISGGAAGDAPLPEPKNLVEARQQARDSGFFD